MPRGRRFCGSRTSSALVATTSKPMKAKNTSDARGEQAEDAVLRGRGAGRPGEERLRPGVRGSALGRHGLGDERHVVRRVDEEEARRRSRTARCSTLMIVNTISTRAVSFVPATSSAVKTATIRNGGPAHLEAQRSSTVAGNGMPTASECLAEVDAPVLRDHAPRREHLEDQVPADDPREELAHGRVREGVGAAGNGHGRGELGVAHDRERAGDARRGRTRWSRSGPAKFAAACAPTEKMPAPTATAMPMSVRSQVPSDRLRLRSSSAASAIEASTDFTRRFMRSPRKLAARCARCAAPYQRTMCIARAASVSEPDSDG